MWKLISRNSGSVTGPHHVRTKPDRLASSASRVDSFDFLPSNGSGIGSHPPSRLSASSLLRGFDQGTFGAQTAAPKAEKEPRYCGLPLRQSLCVIAPNFTLLCSMLLFASMQDFLGTRRFIAAESPSFSLSCRVRRVVFWFMLLL